MMMTPVIIMRDAVIAFQRFALVGCSEIYVPRIKVKQSHII